MPSTKTTNSSSTANVTPFAPRGGATARAGDQSPGPVVGATLRELAERPWPDREHVFEPWLRQGEAAMVWAQTGVGKTMLSLTLALMAAGGGTVAGWRSPKPRRVLIVDGEMHGKDLRDRLLSLRGAVDGLDAEAAMDNIEIMARHMQRPGVRFHDLADERTHDALAWHVQRTKAELVILDNVTTLTDSLSEENEVGAVKPILNFVMRLKQQEVASLVVHHSNKGGTNYRGSTGLVAPLEAVIGLTRPEGAEPGHACFKVEFGKFRHRGQGLRPRVFTLEEREDGGGAAWAVREDEDSLVGRLVAEIRTCQHGTQEAAGEAVGIADASKVSRLLAQAYGDQRIKKAEVKECLRLAREAGAEADLSL